MSLMNIKLIRKKIEVNLPKMGHFSVKNTVNSYTHVVYPKQL